MKKKKNTQAGTTRDKNQLWPNFFHDKLAHNKGFAKKWCEPDFWPIDLWPRAHLEILVKSDIYYSPNLQFWSILRPNLPLENQK